MGKSLVEKLYTGELYPAEKIEPKDSRYKELLRRYKELESMLEKKMPPELQKDFQTYKRLMLECNSLELDATYAAGFHIAVRIILEAVSGQ